MADCLDNLEILANYISLTQSPSRVRFVHVSRSSGLCVCPFLRPLLPPSLSSGLLSSDAGTSSAFTGHIWALGQRPADWSIWCWIISGSARVDVTNGGGGGCLPAWSDIRNCEEGKRDRQRGDPPVPIWAVPIINPSLKEELVEELKQHIIMRLFFFWYRCDVSSSLSSLATSFFSFWGHSALIFKT